MKDFADAVMEMVNVAIEQSTPDQREAWIRDQVTNGFKGTSMEGKEDDFLNSGDPLTVLETARINPSSFKSMIVLGNQAIEDSKKHASTSLKTNTIK